MERYKIGARLYYLWAMEKLIRIVVNFGRSSTDHLNRQVTKLKVDMEAYRDKTMVR